MKIPEIFKKCQEITMSKRQDYTTNPEKNNHENFERSAEIASWFKDKEDKPYAVLIGTKLARLGSLLSSGRTPNNESIGDTFIDLINYSALWMERRTLHNAQVKEGSGTVVNEVDALLGISSSDLHNYKYKCEICARVFEDTDTADFIHHCKMMHSALYNASQNTLKFPNGTIRVLAPSLEK